MVMDRVALAFLPYGHEVSPPGGNIAHYGFTWGRLLLRVPIDSRGHIKGDLSESDQLPLEGGARALQRGLNVDLVRLTWDPAIRSYATSNEEDPVPVGVEATLDQLQVGDSGE
jgi:hypothetical protein